MGLWRVASESGPPAGGDPCLLNLSQPRMYGMRPMMPSQNENYSETINKMRQTCGYSSPLPAPSPYRPNSSLAPAACAGDTRSGKTTSTLTSRSPFFFADPALEMGMPSPGILIVCPGLSGAPPVLVLG